MGGVPQVSQGQIDEMNRIAKEKYGTEPVVEEAPVQEEEAPIEEAPIEEEAPAEEQEVAQEVVAEEPEPAKKVTDKEENMRVLRERYERSERSRDELSQQVQDLQGRYREQEPQKTKEPEEDFDDLQFEPDDLAEGKHLLKLVKKIKNLEEKLDRNAANAQVSTAEIKVKRDFPDFEKVASQENLKKLREMDPDLADAILSAPGIYKKHALAYKMVKQMGIYIEDNHTKERAVAVNNASKPRPLASISPQRGDSPLSKANAFAGGLTEDLKKQLHKEMIEAMKNH